MSQMPVKWTAESFLKEQRTTLHRIPVVELSALREVVEELSDLPHKEGCAVFKDLLDGGSGECSCPKRLLASLREVG